MLAQRKQAEIPERSDALAASHPAAPETIELSILMPCLNEAETLERCIHKGRQFWKKMRSTAK
jgi:hypothetical protein